MNIKSSTCEEKEFTKDFEKPRSAKEHIKQLFHW